MSISDRCQIPAKIGTAFKRSNWYFLKIRKVIKWELDKWIFGDPHQGLNSGQTYCNFFCKSQHHCAPYPQNQCSLYWLLAVRTWDYPHINSEISLPCSYASWLHVTWDQHQHGFVIRLSFNSMSDNTWSADQASDQRKIHKNILNMNFRDIKFLRQCGKNKLMGSLVERK